MAEVVPAKNRGLLVDLHGAMYVLGYMAAAWVGYGFYFMDSKDAWRPPFGTLWWITEEGGMTDVLQHYNAFLRLFFSPGYIGCPRVPDGC